MSANGGLFSVYTRIERFVLTLKDRLNSNDLNRLFLEVFFGRTLTLLAIISSVCMMNWWPSALATFIFPRTVLLLPDILRLCERAKIVFSRARLRAHSLLSPMDQLNRPLFDTRLVEALLSCVSSFGNILACIGFVYSFFNVSSIQIAQIDEVNVSRLPTWLRPPTGDSLLFFSPLVLSVALEFLIIALISVSELVRAKVLQRRIARLNQTPREGFQVARAHLLKFMARITSSRWFSWFTGIEVALVYVFVCSLNSSIDPRTVSLAERVSSLETAKSAILAAVTLATLLYGSLALVSLCLFFPVCIKTWMRYIVKAWRHSELVEIEVESYHRHFRIAAAREGGHEPLEEDVLEVARERQNHFRPRPESELRTTLLRVLRYRANWWFVFCLFSSSSIVAGCSGYLLNLLEGRGLFLISLFKRQLDESSGGGGGGGGSGRVVNRTFRSILDEAEEVDNAVISGSPLGSFTIKISIWLVVINGLVLGSLLLLAHALQGVWSADTQAMLGGLTANDDVIGGGGGGGRDNSKPSNNESLKQQLPLFLERIQDGVYRRIEEDRIARRSGLLVITNPLHCLVDVRDAINRRKSTTSAAAAAVVAEQKMRTKALEMERREREAVFPSSPRNAPPYLSKEEEEEINKKMNKMGDKKNWVDNDNSSFSTPIAPSLALLNAASIVHVHVSPLHTLLNQRNPIPMAPPLSSSSTSISSSRPGLVTIIDRSSAAASRASRQGRDLTLRNVVVVNNTISASSSSSSSSSISSSHRPYDGESKDDINESTCVISLRAEPVQEVVIIPSSSFSSSSSSSFTTSTTVGVCRASDRNRSSCVNDKTHNAGRVSSPRGVVSSPFSSSSSSSSSLSSQSPAAIADALLHQQQTPRRHEPRPPCYICMETAADSVFLECGHGGVCAVCAGIIMRGKLEMHRASISSNGIGLVLVDDGEEDDDNNNAATLGNALTNAFGGGFGRRTLATAEAANAAAAATAASDTDYSLSSRDGGSSLRWPIYTGGTGTCPMCRATVTSVVRIGPDVAMTDGRIVALILPHSYWRDGEHSPRVVVSTGMLDGSSKLGLSLTPRTLWATATTTEELELSGAMSERFRL